MFHRFGTTLFHFHLSLGMLSFLLWFLQWSTCCSIVYCLVSMYSVFCSFFLVVDFWSHNIVVKKDAWYDFSFHNLPWLILWPRVTSLVAQMVKRLPTMWETQVWSPGWEDLLEKEMATHSSILAWKIPWTEEPLKLQSMESQRVGHNWMTSLHFTLIA